MARVIIFSSEDTAPLGPFDGTILDLSELGLCLRISTFPRQAYGKLLRRKCMAQITACLPGATGNTNLNADIRWLDFHDPPAEPACSLGVSFRSLSEPAQIDLTRSLAVLRGRVDAS